VTEPDAEPAWLHRRNPIPWFVLFAFLIGTAAALFNPAFGGYDEGDHFLRAWQISDARLTGVRGIGTDGKETHGGSIPANIPLNIFTLKVVGEEQPGDAGRVFRYLGSTGPIGHPKFVEFPATASYSPIPYLGSAIGIRISRWFDLSTLVTLWFARIGSLSLYIAIVARAMYHLRQRAWLIATLAITPVCLFQAATVSADGTTIALALLAIAFAIRVVLLDNTPTVSRAVALEAIGIALALALAKPPDVLFLLLLTPAVLRRGSSNRRRLWATVCALGFAASGAWSIYAQRVYEAPARLTNVDSGRQLRFVAAHPFRFGQAVATTASHEGLRIARETLVSSPTWLPPTAFLVGALCVIVAAIAVAVGSPARGNDTGARTFALTAAATTGLVALAVLLLAYAGWNAVGARRIDELQGRYLFPCLALVVLVAGSRARHAVVDGMVPLCLVASVTATTVIGICVHSY
jgi:uncharacterized membrane protein